MAQNRKNNHYHYAEKFEDRRRRQRKLFIPKKTAVVAALFLLIFGIVCTTFSAYVSDNIHTEERERSILVTLRNTKAQRDVALTGAEADLASTGFSCSGGYIYFDANGWTIPSGYKVYFVIGRDHDSWWASSYAMTNISGTTTWYLNMGSWGSGNNEWPTQLCFLVSNESIDQGNSPAQIKASKSYNNQHTNTYGGTDLSSGTYYYFEKVTGTDSALTCTSNSSPNSLLNSVANAYTTVKQGDGNYDPGTSGGTITVSGKTKNSNTTTGTDSFSIGHGETNYPIVGSTLSLSNSPATGYKFDGYYPNNGLSGTAYGNSIVMTKIGNNSTNIYAHFSEVMHNVTVNTNIPGDTSTTTSSCVGVATGKELSAPAKTGYTFSNWTIPSGVTISSGSTTSNTITVKYSSTATSAETITLTANYTINPPTKATIDDKTTTVNTDVSLDPSVTIAAPNATAVNTYSITKGGSATSDATVTSAGVFNATKPGVYTVTLSSVATKAASGGVAALTSTAKTDTATVTVLPAKPQWTLTMSGFDPSGDLDNGHTYGFDELNPYLVTLGSNFSFTAFVNSPPNDSSYVYTWYNANDEVLGSVTSTGSSDTTKITFGNQNASEATTATVVLPVKLKVTYTGTDDSVIYADGDQITVYYYIENLINSFEVPALQKIYDNPNDAKMDIEYNITNGSGYTTTLYASSDNVNFYEAVTAAGFLGTQIGTSAVYELDPSANDGPMSKNGPKYFYLNMGKSGANAKTDIVHTTVGADNANGTRQIYFINNSGLDLTDYRVMAFFVDGDGQSYYQTAQDVYKGIAGKPQNTRFRVTIPASATEISFGIAKASRYAVPSYENDNFDYTMGNSEAGKDNVYFVAYTPSMITLDDDHNTINATAKTLVSGYTDTGAEPNPFYTLTTSYVSYVSAD